MTTFALKNDVVHCRLKLMKKRGPQITQITLIFFNLCKSV